MKPLPLLALLPLAAVAATPTPSPRPNILVIMSDDQGYADAGFQGSKEAVTPNLDRLAASGVRCTAGYVTHPVCSPSRAGLLTGRYQSRFGHERNPQPESPEDGLPVSEKLLPQYLQPAGYDTCWIGKWHLGQVEKFWPQNRGFTETYGFLGGGHYFLPRKTNRPDEYDWPVLHNGKPVEVKGHLTLDLGRHAARYITDHKSAPWFMYLAFNAPHVPHQPTKERLEKFAHIADKQRRAYLAQISLMDDAIGDAIDALRATGQEQNTLVFFLSDNGGPTYAGADNGPLRGGKGMAYEGGVRVPFLVSWPSRIPGGRDYTRPVSALDIFATAVAAAGLPPQTDKPREGVDLTPFLTGQTAGEPHRALFWRLTDQEKRMWGVRRGDDKLVWIERKPVIFDGKWWCYRKDAGPKAAWLAHRPEELYDLSRDLGEKSDLGETNAAKRREMLTELARWDRDGVPLAFGANGPDGPNEGRHPGAD